MYELSWVRLILGTICLGYDLSWVRLIMCTSCLGYEFSINHSPTSPFCNYLRCRTIYHVHIWKGSPPGASTPAKYECDSPDLVFECRILLLALWEGTLPRLWKTRIKENSYTGECVYSYENGENYRTEGVVEWPPTHKRNPVDSYTASSHSPNPACH